MIIKNYWQLIILTIILLSGCAPTRHGVVHPQDAKSLSDIQWKISQEPLSIVPLDTFEEKHLFE